MRKRRKIGWSRHKYLFIDALSLIIVLDIFLSHTYLKEIFPDDLHKILLIPSLYVVRDIPIFA